MAWWTRALGSTAALAVCVAAGGCGKALGPASGSAPTGSLVAPVSLSPAARSPGVPALITKNTVRLGGQDPALDAAAVARAVYPGLSARTRPAAVTLVDARDWRTALAASALMSAPLRAPLLLTTGSRLPAVTSAALKAMAPVGAPALGGAKVIAVGDAALPGGYPARALPGADPVALASSIEQLLAGVRGSLPHQVLIVGADGSAAYAMPAAGLAAESGAPILFVTAAGVPPATRAALSALSQPTIYVMGPATQVNQAVVAQLRRFGIVKRLRGADPVSNAIAVARFTDGAFGWGVVDPGHGLVFASSARPLDAAAAAPLSASGDYGPLLLLDDPLRIPGGLRSYLSSIQPGYTQDPRYQPVRGVYNRGWLIGDQRAISDVTQARLDALLEISPRATPPTPPTVAP